MWYQNRGIDFKELFHETLMKTDEVLEAQKKVGS